jgi:hypothetical protein
MEKAEAAADGLRLGYILLAHEPHGHVAAVAQALLSADPTGLIFIHYDAKASAQEFAALRAILSDAPRAVVLERRAPSGWGQFGLVQACLNAFDAAFERGDPPDFFHLMSASCAPIQPIAAFKAFLADRRDLAFIESAGPDWIVGGLREERYTLYHLFNERAYRTAFYLFVQIQRLFRIRRRVPIPVAPRFGSQWWTLPRAFVMRLRAEIQQNRALLPFFRKTWVPDEMFFQTMVYLLHDTEKISGHSLTYYKFTNQGKPIVFYDDHLDFLKTQGFFFARKISGHAQALQAALWRRAAAPDTSPPPVERIGRKAPDYEARMRAQAAYPLPGQLFYGDQLADDVHGPIRALKHDFVVVWTLNGQADALMAALGEELCAVRYDSRCAAGPGPLRGEQAMLAVSPTLALVRRAAARRSRLIVLDTAAPLELIRALMSTERSGFVAAFPLPGQSRIWMPLLTLAGTAGFQPAADATPLMPTIELPGEAALDQFLEESWDHGHSDLLDEIRDKAQRRAAPRTPGAALNSERVDRLLVDAGPHLDTIVASVEAVATDAALTAELLAGLGRLEVGMAEAARLRLGAPRAALVALDQVEDAG